MTRHVLFAALLASTLLAACATPLSSTQKSELEVYRSKGLEVVEKNPSTGTALGFLPGGGSFYGRNYGLGVVNLLLWPASVLWDPFSGRNGAETINYYATKHSLETNRSTELSSLEAQLAAKTITPDIYLQEKARIEQKYAPQM